MSSGPDLFVVCKNCRAEVSPYITECPYCGTRLRKRAPKLERGGTPKPPKTPRPRLGPLRAGEIPGIRPDRRPYATYLLLIVPIVLTIAGRAGWDGVIDLILPMEGDWWRPVTTQFLYGSTGYEVAALGAVAIFGILLERRHGLWAPLLVFFAGGGGGMYLAIVGDDISLIAAGANGAALAMLAAWAMRDVLGRRRGQDDDSDLLGVLAIAAVVILLPLATDDASALAGLGGGLIGVVLGVILARLAEH